MLQNYLVSTILLFPRITQLSLPATDENATHGLPDISVAQIAHRLAWVETQDDEGRVIIVNRYFHSFVSALYAVEKH